MKNFIDAKTKSGRRRSRGSSATGRVAAAAGATVLMAGPLVWLAKPESAQAALARRDRLLS